jgi:hypothetical protein
VATDRSARWWLAPVIGLIVLFTAAAGLVARHLYQQAAASAEISALTPSAPPTATTGENGPRTVALSPDAGVYPQVNAIRTTLQNYFDSINTQNYNLWTTAVTRARLHLIGGQANWRSELRSTTDSSIVVRRIEAAPDNALLVLLTFTSVQSTNDAPSFAPYPCILWNVVWPFAQENGQWKLDVGPATLVPVYSRCTA